MLSIIVLLQKEFFFCGAEAGEFSSFARYKQGKNSQDLEHAIRKGGLDGFSQILPMFVRLYEVLEINTEAFNKKYGKLDRE